ncbi:MAG: hypothetical protein ACLTSX_00570 [Collinsella sp.]
MRERLRGRARHDRAPRGLMPLPAEAPPTRSSAPAGIKFEGSGFYSTDQRGGGSCTAATSGNCSCRQG